MIADISLAHREILAYIKCRSNDIKLAVQESNLLKWTHRKQLRNWCEIAFLPAKALPTAPTVMRDAKTYFQISD